MEALNLGHMTRGDHTTPKDHACATNTLGRAKQKHMCTLVREKMAVPLEGVRVLRPSQKLVIASIGLNNVIWAPKVIFPDTLHREALSVIQLQWAVIV